MLTHTCQTENTQLNVTSIKQHLWSGKWGNSHLLAQRTDLLGSYRHPLRPIQQRAAELSAVTEMLNCWKKSAKGGWKCKLSIYLRISRGTKNFLNSTNLGWPRRSSSFSSSSPCSSSLLKQDGGKVFLLKKQDVKCMSSLLMLTSSISDSNNYFFTIYERNKIFQFADF